MSSMAGQFLQFKKPVPGGPLYLSRGGPRRDVFMLGLASNNSRGRPGLRPLRGADFGLNNFRFGSVALFMHGASGHLAVT